MTIPRITTCEMWTTTDEVRAMPGAGDSLPSNAVVTEAIAFATGWLYRKSGQQFSGTCTSTVRPTSRDAAWGDYRQPRTGASVPASVSYGWGICGCTDSRCGAGGRGILLGISPITAILEVKVDGTIVAPSTYHVEHWRRLVRHAGSWPTCQNLNLDDTQVGTFSVQLEHGQPPPVEGRKAASALAWQLAKAWRGDTDCQLNERVTNVSRDGYSMTLIAPGDLLKSDGSTGVREVDFFLSAWNPNHLQTRARIASPDVGHATGR